MTEENKTNINRAVLAGLNARCLPDGENADETSMEELEELLRTAGGVCVGTVFQNKDTPDPRTFLGEGKVAELKELVGAMGADMVIVDNPLSPSQQRVLSEELGVQVLDRAALILDIFAQHAKSREGKAQVELAQLEYLLPRLRGWGESMSRQAGGQVGGAGAGMGSRGPGETKIELDRRRIRDRMAKLRREIRLMAPGREAQRADRRRHQVPAVAIAGYTNAGKSSLLNRLTGAGVLVENALFATLDPTVRRATTPDGREFTFADTVGFVRHLPTQLVEAFRSTLEEVGDSDLLLHVVDASHPDPEGQVTAVRTVLGEIEGFDVPEIVVLNKADLAAPETIARLRSQVEVSAVVSARTGEGIEELRELIAERLPRPAVEVDVVVPYSRGDLVSRAHTTGEVLAEEHLMEGTRVHALVDETLAAEMRTSS